jgi:hypothetical protein
MPIFVLLAAFLVLLTSFACMLWVPSPQTQTGLITAWYLTVASLCGVVVSPCLAMIFHTAWLDIFGFTLALLMSSFFLFLWFDVPGYDSGYGNGGWGGGGGPDDDDEPQGPGPIDWNAFDKQRDAWSKTCV